MQFIHCEGPEPGRQALLGKITDVLAARQSLVWLVSGGSNIGISIEVARELVAQSVDTSWLSVMLIDERYGEVGHADSNYEQFMQAGWPEQLPFTPVLQIGLSLSDIAEAYNARLAAAFTDNDYCIGQLGIGADGHTAGILPHTPAADELSTDRFVTSYQSNPYQRITTTFHALEQLSEAFVFAFGGDKQEPLNQLLTMDLPLAQQPAQIFKRIPSSYIYNDQVGEPI